MLPRRTNSVSAPRLTYLVKRLELVIRSRLDAVTASVGLTTPQYAALSVLRESEGVSSASLARHSFVSAQAMSEMVSALERKGFVTREPSPDHRRVLRLYITEKGEEVLTTLDRAVDDVEAIMIEALDPDLLESLPAVLTQCYQTLAAGEVRAASSRAGRIGG